MKPKYIIGLAIILAFIIFAGMNLKKSLTPYVSLADARKTNAVVQVKGQRVPGTENFDMDEQTFRFQMVDEQGEKFQVIYDGVKPSNFEQATEVVAIGKYSNGTFEAEQLLVKCPSKYEAEGVKT
jgi:cytochrome c-type biogenesis protein CcmE